jgi:hypothetical protein
MKRSREEEEKTPTSRPVTIKADNLKKIRMSEVLQWNENESKKFEEAVEQERKARDLMWLLFDGNEKEKMRQHLDGIITHVKELYGANLEGLVTDLTYSKQTRSNGDKIKRFTKGEHYESAESKHIPTRLEFLKTMEWMRDSDDVNLHHALWFASLLLFPAISDWLLTQPLSNKENCKFWIKHCIEPSLTELLGPMSEGITLEGWVRDLRAEYVTLCGFAFPEFHPPPQ